MPGRLVIVLLIAVLLAGCGVASSAAPVSTPTRLPARPPATAVATAPLPASSAPTSDLERLSFRLVPVVQGLRRPTHVTSAGDGSGRLFVVEQAGQVRIVRNGRLLPQPFLDIASLVGSRGNEQGLLSIAFHPRFADNGAFFVNYTSRDGATVVARYRVAATNPDQADPRSAAVLLTIEQPAANHNGGLVKFGPDGYLYIGTGDGGAAGDPWNNGQRLDTLLGKLLRIDVDGAAPYAIPPDNPMLKRAGARPEIWAYGLRNPWRFSFDRSTGDLFIADVGQNAWEEVHFQPGGSSGGANYGWKIMEGQECFRASTCDQSGLELPIAVYGHASPAGGCSITGGYVYRGAAFPQLVGVYLYADYCSGNLWGLRAGPTGWTGGLLDVLKIRPSSFGEDEAGELYLTDHGGGLYRLVVEQGA
ncbi:MAG: PQQ-dependent sugar dehydrogenase [Chloroflexaceae bacterium]